MAVPLAVTTLPMLDFVVDHLLSLQSGSFEQFCINLANKKLQQHFNPARAEPNVSLFCPVSSCVCSFEQFCINLANEKLQQHFNQHVFKSEQEEYEEEEIQWSYIDFVDNQDVLELIEKKPMGIDRAAGRAVHVPKSHPETFSTKLYQTLSSHRRSREAEAVAESVHGRPLRGEGDVRCGAVPGEEQGLRDPWSTRTCSACRRTGSSRDLFPLAATAAKSKFTSLGSVFKQQLEKLMATLNTMDPHYIRCVKPNDAHRPGLFQQRSVIQQLRCGVSGPCLPHLSESQCAGYSVQ